jgi:hypothetical protein
MLRQVAKALAGSHAMHASICVALGIAAGIAVAWTFGIGLKPDKEIFTSNFGHSEALRLPVSARRKDNIKSFIIKVQNVDDYGRVLLNNSLAIMRDAADDIFYGPKPLNDDEEKKRADSKRYVHDRQNRGGHEREVADLLQQGENWLVFEVENSMWGGCNLRVDIAVNGQSLEGFPRNLVPREIGTPLVSNTLLETFVGVVQIDKVNPGLTLSEEDDALCGRQLFSFTLLQ